MGLMKMITGNEGSSTPSGTLGLVRIPRNGFYESGLPEGISLKYRLRSYYYEICLRIRLFFWGMVRGLRGSSCGPVARLHLTKYHCRCGDPQSHTRFNSPCPAAKFEHLGLSGTKVVTDAGVAYLVDDMDPTTSAGVDISLFKFHGIGTGVNAEAAGDTALQTEITTEYSTDNTRPTGTSSQPAANQYRTVATITVDAAVAATEHGVLTQAATGGGTLWDRTKYAVVNLANGDSLQATYTVTFPSGS